MELISNSPKETIEIAEKYASSLKGGDVISLVGDLGAGKTLFTKGIAKALGITEPVTSPTYAYMHDYDGKLYHFDFYRLSCGEDAEALGLTDYFYLKGICVVEWACNVSSVMPKCVKEVKISYLGENKRKIEL